MKIAVISANGRTGRNFVTEALRAGHMVKAGVHNQIEILEHINLQIVKCDALRSSDVNNLIKDCDTVVSLIGHGRRSPKKLQSQAIANVINAMKNQNIARLISLTGTAVRVDGDKITLIDRILNFSISIIDHNRIKDGKKHAQLIMDSGLNWTIVRVLKLTNTSHIGKYKLTKNGPTKTFTSRKLVARAILELIEKNEFINHLPMISRK